VKLIVNYFLGETIRSYLFDSWTLFNDWTNRCYSSWFPCHEGKSI